MLLSPVVSTANSFQSTGMSPPSKGLQWPLKTGSHHSHNECDKVTSGQFMVSKLDDSDNEDDCFGQLGCGNGSATPGPHNELLPANIDMLMQFKGESNDEPNDDINIGNAASNNSGCKAIFSIDESLTKLLDCLTLAYSGKITSPKWNQFKGVKFQLKDKVRLNNIIWREYHMQYVKRKKPIVVHFAAPLTENHGRPEAVVMEGKYWKRRLDTICNEYKRWRVWYKNRSKHHSGEEVTNAELLELTAKNEVRRLQTKRPSPPPTLDDIFMDFDSLDLFMDQPFTFPNPRDIGQLGNADIMQPGLIQLQPNLDDVIMSDVLYNILQSSGSMIIDNDNTVSWQNSVTDSSSGTTSDTFSGCSPIVMDSSASVLVQPETSPSLVQHETPNLRSALLQHSPMSYVTAPTSTNASNVLPLQQPTQQSHLAASSQFHPQPSKCPYPESALPPQGSQFLVPSVPNTASPVNAKQNKKPQLSNTQSRVKVRKPNKPVYIQPKLDSPNKKAPIPIAPNPGPVNQSSRSSLATQFYSPPVSSQPFSLTENPSTSLDKQPITRNRSSGNLNSMTTTPSTTPDCQSLLKMVNKVMTGGNVSPLLNVRNMQQSPSALRGFPAISQPNPFSLVTRHASNPNPLTFSHLNSNSHLPVYSTSSIQGGGAMQYRRFSDTACSASSSSSTSNPMFYLGESKPTPVHLEDLLKTPSNSPVHSVAGSMSVVPRMHYPASTVSNNADRSQAQDHPIKENTPTPHILPCSSGELSILNPLSTQGQTSNIFSSASKQRSTNPSSPASSIGGNNSEVMRRNCITASLSRLQELVSSNYHNDLGNLTPQKLSKATVLYKTAQTIKKTRQDLIQKDREIARIKKEIEQLQNSISSCCSQLPATGVAVSRQRANQGKEWFEAYVKASTLMNFKFYIFSLIIADLFDSYNTTVSTNSMDQFTHSLSTWIEQHCSLVKLRPLGMTALRTLSTTTSILTDVKKLPEQATAAVLSSQSGSSTYGMETDCSQYQMPACDDLSTSLSLSNYGSNYLSSASPISQIDPYPEFISSVRDSDLDSSPSSTIRKDYGDDSCDSFPYH